MARQIEPYFSINTIITGQYTPGNQFITSKGDEYIGLYHILPNKEIWSEELPSKKSFKLQEKLFNVSESVKTYNKINDIDVSRYTSPQVYQPLLTSQDYKVGYVLRFFVQKRNNPFVTIHEISGDQYSSINSRNFSGINGSIWNYTSIKWIISGKSASDMNKRSIAKCETTFPGITSYLSNTLEFVI